MDVQLFTIALDMEDSSASHLILNMEGLILGSKSDWNISKIKEFLDESTLGLIDDTLALDINTISILDLENEELFFTSLASWLESNLHIL